MEDEFSAFLETFSQEIYKNIEELIEAHNKNIEDLNADFDKAMEKLVQQKTQVDKIIMNLKFQDPKVYFPLINEVKNMELEEFEEEKQKWKVEEIKNKAINKEIYRIENISKLDEWKELKIDECKHQRREVLITFCKKPHCKECLKERIEKNYKTCFCNLQLSPKNVHEVMGFILK